MKILAHLKQFLKRRAVKLARAKEDKYWVKRAEEVLARDEPTVSLEEVMTGFEAVDAIDKRFANYTKHKNLVLVDWLGETYVFDERELSKEVAEKIVGRVDESGRIYFIK